MDNVNAYIKTQLVALSDEKNSKFSSSLLPETKNILGVRLPDLRSLAKEIAKGDYGGYLDNALDDTFEEIMLQGMVIGACKADLETRLGYIKAFVPKIDNWSVCDSFCNSLKFTKKNTDVVWDLILPYTKSEKEFEVRFAFVMMLNYFVSDEYIDRIFELIKEQKHEGYYARMAVAWLISVLVVKYGERTLEFLENNDIDEFVFNKAIQKSIESFRVDGEIKKTLKELKKK
ncbi:MAG: DNA alkylation repair protein [Clostridiales bacterium]|nr:DNA alkylation repair protein [Clostridiales bacterium]